MPGARMEGLPLLKVVDGDTVKVEINGDVESLRLVCLDTEESRSGSKPATRAGKLASKWAKKYFGADEEGFPGAGITVDMEFDASDPLEVCLKKHRGNYGRLICYIFKNNENYNLKAVEEGWSPYFVKYGESRLHHAKFMAAEAKAQSLKGPIWNPETNAGGKHRDYDQLIPWWHMRAGVVRDYRGAGVEAGVKSVRLDYEEIVEAAKAQREITVFCDLQGGINQWTDDGAVIYAGSKHQKFNLWLPDRESLPAAEILNLIEKRYAGYGRSYVYVSGKASMWPTNDGGKPQIVLTDKGQLSDFP